MLGLLQWAIHRLYRLSKSWVYIADSKLDLLQEGVGLQGCSLSPILFMNFMDRILRHSQGVQGVQFSDVKILFLQMMSV